MLPAARRFEDHGAVSSDRELPELEQVTLSARSVPSAATEADDDEATIEQLTLRRLRAAE